MGHGGTPWLGMFGAPSPLNRAGCLPGSLAANILNGFQEFIRDARIPERSPRSRERGQRRAGCMQQWEPASCPGRGRRFLRCVPECPAQKLCLEGIGHETPGMESLQPQQPILFHARFRESENTPASSNTSTMPLGLGTDCSLCLGRFSPDGCDLPLASCTSLRNIICQLFRKQALLQSFQFSSPA